MTETSQPVAPKIVGILNLTPDSFSDGGEHNSPAAAIARAEELRAAGADIIDVGGESTRPGAERVSGKKERRRVLPIIRELIDRDIPVSIDTMNATTARAAAELGVRIINDVSGGQVDEKMAEAVIDTGSELVISHWRAPSAIMDAHSSYTDVVAEVRAELEMRAAELVVRGVDPAKLIVDPGLGFAKTVDQSWLVLAHLRELRSIGCRVLVGASRKKFLAPLLADGATAKRRDPASAFLSALAAESGAWAVRVHDVAATRAALDLWSTLRTADHSTADHSSTDHRSTDHRSAARHDG